MKLYYDLPSHWFGCNGISRIFNLEYKECSQETRKHSKVRISGQLFNFIHDNISKTFEKGKKAVANL